MDRLDLFTAAALAGLATRPRLTHTTSGDGRAVTLVAVPAEDIGREAVELARGALEALGPAPSPNESTITFKLPPTEEEVGAMIRALLEKMAGETGTDPDLPKFGHDKPAVRKARG